MDGSPRLSLLKKRIAAAGLTIQGEDESAVRQLEKSIGRRDQQRNALRRQIEHLQGCLDQLEREAQVIDHEVGGLEKTLEALLADFLDRTKTEWREHWSPHPIIGFRAWTIDQDGLHGAKLRWTSRSLKAGCYPFFRPQDGIPHSEGECGDPPCGIYATKALTTLLSFMGDTPVGIALGMVALTGRVIEHEHGYRAGEAEVLALTVVDGIHVLCTSIPEEIDGLFVSTGGQIRGRCQPEPFALEKAAQYLEEQARRNQCTLANN